MSTTDAIESIQNDISKLNNIYKLLNELESSSPNLCRYFNKKSFSFSHEQIRIEIDRLNESIDELEGKEKTSFSMNITIDLREGMTIKELYNDDSEEYALVQSSVDYELYGIGSSKIIKLSEINQDDYICEDIDFFEKEKDYFEFENGRVLNSDDEVEKKTKLVEMDEHLWGEIQEQIEDMPFANYDNDFVDISVRKVSMKIEEFEIRSNGSKLKYINYRDKVKDKHEELT